MPELETKRELLDANGLLLFYCERFDKHFAVPPNSIDIWLGIIPRFTCYDCNIRCPYQQANRDYIMDLVSGMLNSRNSYRGDDLNALRDYKLKLEGTIL